MLDAYREHVKEREALGIPPLPLNAEQTNLLIALLKNPPQGEEDFLLHLLEHRIAPGVDEAAYVKAGFLAAITRGEDNSPLINGKKATEILGTMLGGYNIQPLIQLLDNETLAPIAAAALKKTLLMFDAFHDVVEKANTNSHAQSVLQSWADAEWFTRRDPVPEKLTLTVFQVKGETNTDDLSPAPEAWSRPDIPLHANAMLMNTMPGALDQLAELKQKGHPIAYVGDVVGTGSSRKSAINSLLWHIGREIPFVPNKKQGGVILGGQIAPIFFNTAEDSGALPIEVDVTAMSMGDVIHVYPYEGRITDDRGKEIATFALHPSSLTDEVRAGGRIPLIIGRSLTAKARDHLGLPPSDIFIPPHGDKEQDSHKGYTAAQKMVGRACGTKGIRPGTYCEPQVNTVGSQDTTGPMTRDELKELACLGFSADLVMQSFCHTAAYPKPTDIKTQHELPDFFSNRGGVVLRPGDGIIHPWINRMLVPDIVGTGGDSHTRFPMGISFPAGSGLVAFAAAMGVMPLDMPESVLVRFSGEIQPGITLRDLVHAIPYVAIQKGLLTVAKKNKKNVFSGRVLEIEGLPDLKLEQAFELADASAERSANGCTIKLNKEPMIEYLNSNITLLKWMIANGYQSERTLRRRIDAMEAWLADPQLIEADKDAEYAEIIDINLNDITEPLLCCPNDPDDVKSLSEVQGTHVDEVFIGSCMTNIGHYRAAGHLLKSAKGVPTRLWIVPPTKMDAKQLTEEGYYAIFGTAGARTEVPGCSLCMGNQARVADGATVVSTSTRNFPNRMGKDANVFLSSAELAALTAIKGAIPTVEEYHAAMQDITAKGEEVYRYMNFDKIPAFKDAADTV
ncbi:MAG: bifunctional aconitate hydratase 2/2-methylisocitrate dehydratase [Gammaproteobacteria bacterium]